MLQSNYQALTKNHKPLILLKNFKLSSLFLSLLSITSFSTLLIVTNSANAALTAVTANTIHGTAPKFTATSGANKLGFVINGTNYSEQIGNITSATPKFLSGGLTFNDFTVATFLTTADFNVATDYQDDDGDDAHPTTPFTIGTTTYSWEDGSNTPIPPADYNKMIGCGNGYTMPLRLTITTAVQIRSEYGDPRDNTASLTKTYEIDSSTGICYLKPNQMNVFPGESWAGYNTAGVFTGWNTGTGYRHPTYGGGYSSDFVPGKGFIAGAATKFPTTGFPGAQFDMVMSNASNLWTYTVESGSNVTVSPTGQVLLTGKPGGTGSVTIKATLKSDTSIFYEYTFNPTTVWLAFPSPYNDGHANAVTICGGLNNLPSRAELTNSPYSPPFGGVGFRDNSGTRAIGGGVLTEWGRIRSDAGVSAYPSNPNLTFISAIRTREVVPASTGLAWHYVVGFNAMDVTLGLGTINHLRVNYAAGVACKM